MTTESVLSKVAFGIRVLILSISACFLCSAFGNLQQYSTHTPNIIIGEEVYIRGVPMLAVFNSLFWGGVFSLVERFINIFFEYVVPRISGKSKSDAKQ